MKIVCIERIFVLTVCLFYPRLAVLYKYHGDSKTNETADGKGHSRKPWRSFVSPTDRKNKLYCILCTYSKHLYFQLCLLNDIDMYLCTYMYILYMNINVLHIRAKKLCTRCNFVISEFYPRLNKFLSAMALQLARWIF